MHQKINVSGNSLSLRWLVNFCEKTSPWMTLSPQGVSIDWAAAIAYRQQQEGKSFTPDPALHQAMTTMLPHIDWQSNSFASRTPALTFSLEGPLTPLPRDLIESLTVLHETLDIVIRELSKFSPQNSAAQWAKVQINNYLPKIKAAQKATTVATMRVVNHLSYSLRHRLIVSRSDMTTFLLGADPSTLYYSSRMPTAAHQAESKRLTRRLIKIHLDCFERLAEMEHRSQEEDFDSDTEAFRASWRAMGLIERSLALLINHNPLTPSRAGTPIFCRLSTSSKLASANGQFVLEREPQPSYFGPNETWSTVPLYPLAHTLEGLPNWLRAIDQALPLTIMTTSIDLAITRTFDTLKHLKEAKTEKAKIQHANSLAHDIEEMMDWLIAESPLLTFLCSGFLTLYSDSTPSYGLSLSPWVTSSVFAQKAFGQLPLTYLDNGPSAEDETTSDNSGEDEDSPACQSILSGHLVWQAQH